MCEGRPRGFRRPVKDVRFASGQEVCREDKKEAGIVLRLDRWDTQRADMWGGGEDRCLTGEWCSGENCMGGGRGGGR